MLGLSDTKAVLQTPQSSSYQELQASASSLVGYPGNMGIHWYRERRLIRVRGVIRPCILAGTSNAQPHELEEKVLPGYHQPTEMGPTPGCHCLIARWHPQDLGNLRAFRNAMA